MDEQEIIANLVRIAEQESVYAIEVVVPAPEGGGREQRYAIQMMPVMPDAPFSGGETAVGANGAQADEALSVEERLAPPPAHIVRSPIVGSFHRGVEPGGKPLVTEGQTVSVGQTLCCVESLKVFREVASDVNGVVRAILVEDGEPVDYGKPLLEIEPTRE